MGRKIVYGYDCPCGWSMLFPYYQGKFVQCDHCGQKIQLTWKDFANNVVVKKKDNDGNAYEVTKRTNL